jgi:hypothetical protein
MSALPLELQLYIIELFYENTKSKGSLTILARVSRPMRQEAERLLYTSAFVNVFHPRLVLFFITLATVPRIAHLIRCLDIRWFPNLPSLAFWSLMHAALANATQLHQLRLDSRGFRLALHSPRRWVFWSCHCKFVVGEWPSLPLI